MTLLIQKRLFILYTVLFLSTLPSHSSQFISAVDPNLQYVGRVWSSNSCENLTWPGSYVKGRFTGTSLSLVLAESTKNSIWVKIDKNDWRVINDLGTDTVIQITSEKLPVGLHEFTILKKTEGYFGKLSIKGFLIDNEETIFPPSLKTKKKIELIGDSITAGFAVTGRPNAVNNDATATYGYIASEKLNLELWITAVSGIGISHNYGTTKDEGTMPKRYQRLDFDIDTSQVDFKTWQPDVITINLGTNDRSAPCDTTLFETRFTEFLTNLRTLHPKTWILVLRPFRGYFAGNENKIVSNRQKAGDSHLEYIDTDGWLDPKTDFTDGTHPNPQGHQKAADRLASILEKYIK